MMQAQRLPEHAAEMGTYFLDRLRAINASQIREVRGLGLMLGVEMKGKVAPYLRGLMERRRSRK